jgi:hypothetical protein
MIASMLQRLYSKVAGTGVVPLQWQSAVLTPIYKQKGDVNDLGNYRPLSVPTVTCRLWSTITNHRLMQEIGDILPDSMIVYLVSDLTDPALILYSCCVTCMTPRGLMQARYLRQPSWICQVHMIVSIVASCLTN